MSVSNATKIILAFRSGGICAFPKCRKHLTYDAKVGDDTYIAEQLETIKLEDGIHHHEHVKVELEIYARQNNVPVVKPFMLVVAQDTEHARQIRIVLESQGFFDGRYKGKVAEIHSGQSGTEADENIQKLIAVENSSEATEIVVHVNKLKEGWDVTNLYTIVPLRASASEILTEQTLGRGLRLPYGKHTGVEGVDRLTVIAHDKFQAIVDAANDKNSIIRKTIEIGEGGDISPYTPQAVEVPSLAESLLTGRGVSGIETTTEDQAPLFSREEQEVAAVTLEVARKFERLDSVSRLAQADIQEKICQEVQSILRPNQGTLNGVLPQVDIAKVVATVTKNLVEFTIDIPNIVLLPTSEVNFGFKDFNLQGLDRINYQPHSNEILIQNLHTNTKSTLLNAESLAQEDQPEDYIVRCLIEHEEVDYDTVSDLLYKLSGQVVSRLHSYLADAEQVENVALNNQRAFSDFIFSQMKSHYWETPTDYKVLISKGFSLLRPANFSLPAGEQARYFREIPENKQAVKRMLFTGFRKCCYPLQKFDSVDGELRLAILLEDDTEVLRWMKPASHHFQIEYKRGIPYEPDFVVETHTEKLLIEPKMASEIQDEDVQLKVKAAEKWCQHATEHALHHGGKPWHYMLVPHSAITANSSLAGLKRQFLDNRLF
jgi:type III restriction enzyme